jgi:hypothetical protein
MQQDHNHGLVFSDNEGGAVGERKRMRRALRCSRPSEFVVALGSSAAAPTTLDKAALFGFKASVPRGKGSASIGCLVAFVCVHWIVCRRASPLTFCHRVGDSIRKGTHSHFIEYRATSIHWLPESIPFAARSKLAPAKVGPCSHFKK